MKKCLTVLLCLHICCCSIAQSITSIEYFIDTDPGPGSGIPINSFTPADTARVNNFPLASNFSPGVHALYVRAATDAGWSGTESFPFFVASIQQAATLVGAEYFIDMDPGVGHGIPVNIGNATDTAHLVFQVPGGASTGMHTVNVRFKDQAGNYSLYESFPFYVTPEITNMPPIIAAEYFFGIKDPGVGHATPLNVSPGGDTVIRSFYIPVSCQNTTVDSVYNFYIRVKDALGRWSLFEKDSFNLRGPNTVITVKNGAWSDPTIWSNNAVPDAATDVVLKHSVTVDVNAVCRQLYTFCNTVNIVPGKTVTVKVSQ